MFTRIVSWFTDIDWNSEAITAAATVTLAFMTLILAGGTIFLWLATRRLVKDAGKTAEHQLRAYVHVSGADLSKPPQSGWMALIKIDNFGQTPAYNTKIRVEKKFGLAIDKDTILEFSKDAVVQPESSIGPGAFMTVTIDFSEIPKRSDWEALRAANMKAYVWGRIDYIDAFEEPRFTTFQMVHNFTDVVQFVYCQQGNGTELRLSERPRAVQE